MSQYKQGKRLLMAKSDSYYDAKYKCHAQIVNPKQPIDMNKYNFKTIALNWRWLKIFLPLWIICTGIPLIFMGKQDFPVVLIVASIALLPTIAITLFCIKCFIYYLNESDKQKTELQQLEKEIRQQENERKNQRTGQ